MHLLHINSCHISIQIIYQLSVVYILLCLIVSTSEYNLRYPHDSDLLLYVCVH
jgi:hypothetical protein